jgi:hypothetical protein
MEMHEIKRTIDQLNAEERFFAAAYLKHLSQVDDRSRRLELGERMRRMDAGRTFTHEQAERLHDALSQEGL